MLILVLWVIHQLFGKRLDTLIEALLTYAERDTDRTLNITADLPGIHITNTHEAVPLEPMPADANPNLPDLDTLIEGTPEWYRAVTHNGDGSLAYQPIDPTDADWPDPDPIAAEHRTALIEPGTDLLAQIRATPNPAGVPFPFLGGEMAD